MRIWVLLFSKVCQIIRLTTFCFSRDWWLMCFPISLSLVRTSFCGLCEKLIIDQVNWISICWPLMSMSSFSGSAPQTTQAPKLSSNPQPKIDFSKFIPTLSGNKTAVFCFLLEGRKKLHIKMKKALNVEYETFIFLWFNFWVHFSRFFSQQNFPWCAF